MAKLDFSPIADTTRRAEIVALLRRAILTGQLEPGQKLNELRISEQMRVSRAPLREAMRELVQEGILTSIPYAGTFVINVTAKDIDDAYSFNKVMDELAIERAWKLRDQRFFDELDRRHEAVKQATRDLDTTRQIETALQLHGLIYEWADNSVLLRNLAAADQPAADVLRPPPASSQRAGALGRRPRDLCAATQGQGHACRPAPCP